jgi:hypothetical protein
VKSEYHRPDSTGMKSPNTPKSTDVKGRDIQNGSYQERSSRRGIKGMNGVPTTIYDVHHARKAGLPKRGDLYGDGIPIVVSERESRLQGEVG